MYAIYIQYIYSVYIYSIYNTKVCSVTSKSTQNSSRRASSFKGTLMQIPISSSSYGKNMMKISH